MVTTAKKDDAIKIISYQPNTQNSISQ